jgi:hypothetical protein
VTSSGGASSAIASGAMEQKIAATNSGDINLNRVGEPKDLKRLRHNRVREGTVN